MKHVLINVSEKQLHHPALKNLGQQLSAMGITMSAMSSQDIGDILSENAKTHFAPSDHGPLVLEKTGFDLKDLLILTDRETHLKWAQDRQIACIALDAGEFPGDDLWGASNVLTDLADADPVYLIRCHQHFHDLPWTIANTPRLILRELAESDFPALSNLMKEESTAKWVEPSWETIEEGIAFEKAYRKNMYGFYGFGLWGVFLQSTGELIGRVGFEIRDGFDEPELGYLICEQYRKQGYCLEACSAALTYMQNEYSFPYIHCFIEEGNQASFSIAGKLGFSPDETTEMILQGDRKLCHLIRSMS